MRKYLLVTILSLSLIACGDHQATESNVETVNLDDLIAGPVVHESLSEEQLESIAFIHKTVGEVYPLSLEEMTTNFKRDMNPDSEINIWLNMATAFQLFASKNTAEDKLEQRKEAFKLILMRSMMPEKEAISSSELKFLTEDEIQDILKNYTLEAAPIQVEKR